MKQTNWAKTLGGLTGAAVMTGITALAAFAARKAHRRNLATPDLPGPCWRSLCGPAAAEENGCLLVGDGADAIRFTTDGVPVLDALTGQPLALPPQSGRVLVVYDANAPMALSLPPLCNGAALILACPPAGKLALTRFDHGQAGELTLTPLTPVTDLTGAPCRETEGVDCVALWEQTPGGPVVRRVTVLLDAALTMVPLRARAEALGYQVAWNGFHAPIVLTRDDIRLELTLDSDRFTYRHFTRDLHPLDRMDRLSQPLRLERSTVMAPASLIAALA